MSKRAPKHKVPIPHFPNEDAERRFWSQHDAVDYFDWAGAKSPALPKLKPSTTAISLRLPDSMLEELKCLANKQDVPYQSLMKMYLAEKIRQERSRKES